MTERPMPFRFAPTNRELFFRASGQPVPSPTAEDIVTAIRRSLCLVLSDKTLDEPAVQDALNTAAHAVQQLFPSNPQPKDAA